VVEAALPFWTQHFGNPSSDHPYGARPRAAVAVAREPVARLIGARSDDVVLTGTGSEADLLALRGYVLAGPPGAGTHVVVQATEHPAVLATAAVLTRRYGCRTTVLPVDDEGLVDPDRLAAALDGDAADRRLVSIMLANNGTGAIQPVGELARIAHALGAVVHWDAAQACGKIPVDVDDLDVDLLTVVGHKMYAPRGAAALYLRRTVGELEPVAYGGSQERGLRAGTENVAMAVALGAAAVIAVEDLAEGGPRRVAALRDDLHHRLDTALPGRVRLNGPRDRRLPNTLNVGIAGGVGHRVLAAAPAIAASTGSACHAGEHSPSPVLTAMGQPAEQALGAIRLSLGRSTTPADVETAADALVAAVREVETAILPAAPGGRTTACVDFS
jgi:cysteine desulfurase